MNIKLKIFQYSAIILLFLLNFNRCESPTSSEKIDVIADFISYWNTFPMQIKYHPTSTKDSSLKIVNSIIEIYFEDNSSPSNKIDSWKWDFGDGKISYDKNPIHEYSDYGEYTISLEVSCNHCNTGEITKTFTLEPEGTADLNWNFYQKHVQYEWQNKNCIEYTLINTSSYNITYVYFLMKFWFTDFTYVECDILKTGFSLPPGMEINVNQEVYPDYYAVPNWQSDRTIDYVEVLNYSPASCGVSFDYGK